MTSFKILYNPASKGGRSMKKCFICDDYIMPWERTIQLENTRAKTLCMKRVHTRCGIGFLTGRIDYQENGE